MRYTQLPPVKRGDTWSFTFTWQNNNIPTNLTGCTAKMQIRAPKIGVLLAEASTVNSTISITGTTGTVVVNFPAAVTALVDSGTYESDLQVTFPVTGVVQSSSTFQIIVQEDITR